MSAPAASRLPIETPGEVPGGSGPFPEVEPNLDDLRAYVRAKHALAGQVRILRAAFGAQGREQGERRCGELMVKLAEDRFALAVLGQFKRGKSSLLNAIVGREILPTGVLPLTSALTVLKYGPTDRLVVRREGPQAPEERPLASLADFATEKGNPGNRLKIESVCLELPVPFLRRGVEFVDTPGVGSAIAANTATACAFLPECDAALFVTGMDAPMTSLELAFLEEIRGYVDKIFFVVNKTDLAENGEREEILRFVAETIRARTGDAAPKIYPVSARLGLAAKAGRDVALYARSGLTDLEEALAAFLSKEKAETFLASIARKALRTWEEEGSPEILRGAPAQARAKLEKWLSGIQQGRLADLAAATAWAPAATEAEAADVAAAVSAPAKTVRSANRKAPGCPICGQIESAAWEFFADWQYALATEEPAQDRFAAELGFCPVHTWQLHAVSSPHGASIGFARLAEQMAHRLGESGVAATGGDAVRRLARDARNCRVCALLKRTEEEAVARLAAELAEAEARDAYRRSHGACLRHLGMLADSVAAPGIREFLVRHAARRFEEEAEDMQGFAMKDEALRRAAQNRDEREAYERTIVRMAGGRNVCMPWRENA